MQNNKKYRHEIKQLITKGQFEILLSRMKALLAPDEHMPEEGGYYISSLYLDDWHNTAVTEKEAGAALRKKYRIRIYNGSDSFVRLECKEKLLDRISKRSTSIDKTCLDGIVNGDFSPLAAFDEPLCREVYALNKNVMLKPAVIVNYIRYAFVHPLSNVRITFDCGLSACVNTYDMFAPEQDNLFIFDRDETVLEIKYDNYIPTYVVDALRCNSQRLAVSKYVLCRQKLQECFKDGTLNQIGTSDNEKSKIQVIGMR